MNSLMPHTLRSIAAFLFLNFLKEASSEIRNTPNDRYPVFDIQITTIQPNQRLLLCPAHTEVEKELNELFSLGKNGLFTVDRITDSFDNKLPDICHNLIKPVIIYNLIDQQYEVGYEFYIEERLIEPKFSANINYNSFASINKDNEIINSTKFSQEMYHQSSLKYQDGDWTIIKMNAEPYRPRIFHWKSELHFKYREFNKMTQRIISIEDVQDDDVKYKCSDDFLEDNILKIYSEQNQETCLMDIERPTPLPETQTQTQTGTSYQQIQTKNHYLAKSQIIPSWYFHTSWSKKASCSRMNIVPIWKTIADGQLKNVDLYLLAAEYHLRKNENYSVMDTIFGVSDILNLPNKNNPSTSRNRYLWDFETRDSQKIPIPKIIYRIFSLTSIDCGRYSVAIIIHNSLTSVSDTERICSPESRSTGWGTIENKDPSIGLTYTCPVTSEVLTKLGGFEGTIVSSEFLRLDGVPNRVIEYGSELLEPSESLLDKGGSVEWSEYWLKSPESSPSPMTTISLQEYRDETSKINTEFQRLLQLE